MFMLVKSLVYPFLSFLPFRYLYKNENKMAILNCKPNNRMLITSCCNIPSQHTSAYPDISNLAIIDFLHKWYQQFCVYLQHPACNTHVLALIMEWSMSWAQYWGQYKTRFCTLKGPNVWEPCKIVSLYLKLTKKIY